VAYNAELQMLREFYLLHAPQITCCFCGKPIMRERDDATFGHRRHTKIWELNFTVHHDDEDRENNARSNLKDSHSTCHRKYHKSLLLHGGTSAKEEIEKEGHDEDKKQQALGGKNA